MKIVRKILAILFALGCVVALLLAGIIFNKYNAPYTPNTPLMEIPLTSIIVNFTQGALIGAGVLLVAAILTWPRLSRAEKAARDRQKKKEAAKKAEEKKLKELSQKAAKKVKEPDFHTPEKKAAAPAPAKKLHMPGDSGAESDPIPEPVPQAPEPGAVANQINKNDAVSLATPEEREEAMARLVSIGQGALTRDVAHKLFQAFFPEIDSIIERVPGEGCDSTVETLARQALNLMRFKIKIKDPNLANDQFATFQKRIFDMEKEELGQMYTPKNRDGLEEVQKQHVGLLVNSRDWERLQRVLQGDREDWTPVSFSNAAEMMEKEAAGQA